MTKTNATTQATAKQIADLINGIVSDYEPTAAEKRAAREACAARKNMRVDVVVGDTEPEVVGSCWHYPAKGESVIQHLSAYGKRGWSDMLYIYSTLRVVVGIGWLASRTPK